MLINYGQGAKILFSEWTPDMVEIAQDVLRMRKEPGYMSRLHEKVERVMGNALGIIDKHLSNDSPTEVDHKRFNQAMSAGQLGVSWMKVYADMNRVIMSRTTDDGLQKVIETVQVGMQRLEAVERRLNTAIEGPRQARLAERDNQVYGEELAKKTR